jgi:hypothetical protein
MAIAAGKFLRVDSKLVLRRPIEPVRITGNLGTRTNFTDYVYRVTQNLIAMIFKQLIRLRFCCQGPLFLRPSPKEKDRQTCVKGIGRPQQNPHGMYADKILRPAPTSPFKANPGKSYQPFRPPSTDKSRRRKASLHRHIFSSRDCPSGVSCRQRHRNRIRRRGPMS